MKIHPFISKLIVTIFYFHGGLVRRDQVLMPKIMPYIGFIYFWGGTIYLLVELFFIILAK
tara:strand:- start:16791 stop:16970 length:180 start_codon:yes stop_codon:yes gene_type:complete